VKGVPEKLYFTSVTVYSKSLYNQRSLNAQIERVQDKRGYIYDVNLSNGIRVNKNIDI